MLLLYRALCWVNSVYPVAVFFTYLAIALATFAVCFLMPVIGVLSLVFSLLSLVPIVFAWKVLQASERWLARKIRSVGVDVDVDASAAARA